MRTKPRTEAGTGAPGFNDGPAASAQFTNVSGIAVTASGDIYVADPVNNRIRLISGGTVSTAAGSATAGSRNGSVAMARFSGPTGVAVNSDASTIVVGDTGNNLIRLISGGMVSTLSGTGSAGYTEGAAGVAQFNGPRHVALAPPGGATLAYAADLENMVIRAIAADGTTSLLAGTPMTAGSSDGPLTSAAFDDPWGVAVGPGGVIVVGDPNNDAVRAIFP